MYIIIDWNLCQTREVLSHHAIFQKRVEIPCSYLRPDVETTVMVKICIIFPHLIIKLMSLRMPDVLINNHY